MSLLQKLSCENIPTYKRTNEVKFDKIDQILFFFQKDQNLYLKVLVCQAFMYKGQHLRVLIKMEQNLKSFPFDTI